MTASSLPDVLAPAAGSRFPHRARALLGLFAPPGASLDAFETGLIDWQRGRCPRELELLRVGVRIAGTEDDLQETIGSYFHQTITPLDGFITIDIDVERPELAELDALVAGLESVGDQLADVVDRERSFAMAGLVNLVVADDGPYAMILMGAHHPGVKLVDTHAWWCSFGEVVHAAGPGHTLGYHQVQCDPELSSRAAKAAGLSPTTFDLGDLVYLSIVEEFVAAARPQSPLPAADPGPPVNQRDDFITFRGSVGAFCLMLSG